MLMELGIAEIHNWPFRNMGKEKHAENLYQSQFDLNQNLWHSMSVATKNQHVKEHNDMTQLTTLCNDNHVPSSCLEFSLSYN
jgi:hypothetical protein